VIGSVGRLAPEKNYAILVDAVAVLCEGLDAHLLIAGDGPARPQLAARAARAGIADRVVLAGLQADVRAALSAMDVFVLPSVAVETFSNAALEAMAMEKPVVLTHIGGAREMIDDGVEGCIVRCGDRAALLGALRSLAADPESRQRMGAAGRRRVIARFCYDAMVEQYIDAFALRAR
jgi:glycosyltransferase involved in cell wall biosynthesis